MELELKAYRNQVEKRLAELLPPTDTTPTDLHAAMRYATLGNGKRLRPILAMLCSEAVGGKATDALDGGCAIELVHCFSLIHDDLPALDNDATRRGEPTCHVRYGEATAILAGDALFSLAFEVLAAIQAEPSRILDCVRCLSEATGSNGLVGGEMLDLHAEGRPVSADQLAEIHSKKTAALFAATCKIGAILGGGSSESVDSLGQYGEQLGLAFQIADDVLNETGTAEQLGKAARSDRDRQKATYPALFGLEGARKRGLDTVELAMNHLQCFENKKILTEMLQFSIFRDH